MAFWTSGKKESDEQVATPTAVLIPEPAPVVTPLVAEPEVAPTKAPRDLASLSPEEQISERFGSKIRSVLGAGTVIQGKLSFDTPVRIDGKLTGEIFSSKALIIGPTGSIDAQVNVASLYVMGSVSGKVKATERIEVFPGGVLQADISTPALAINDAVFSGACAMTSQPSATTILVAEKDKRAKGESTSSKPKYEESGVHASA